MAREAVTIETPRLILRPLAAGDAAEFLGVNSDPVVRRYLWDDRVVTAEESAGFLAGSVAAWEAEGLGLFGMTPRGESALAGYAGFWRFRDPPVLEIAYALRPAYHGRGLAGEGAAGVMTYGIRELGMTEFRASTDAPNVASVRVLEKLGFTRTDAGDVRGGTLLLFHLPAARVRQEGVRCVAGAIRAGGGGVA